MAVTWKKIAYTGDAPTAHKASHENAGADEISVAGLSGELADDQPPKAHDFDTHTVAAGDMTKYIKVNDGTNVLEWITPADLLTDIAAAAASHTHDTGDLTDFPAFTGAEVGKVLTVDGAGNLYWN